MSLQPVQINQRSEILDILRGFAILGIFIMNLEAFTWYWTLSGDEKAGVMLASYDHTTEFLLYMLVEGKFYSIFSLLFGIGFAIYLSKAETNSTVLRLFMRRLFILFLLGFIHLLFWTGDIIAFYAIVGFILIPFRRIGNKVLLLIAVFCILSPIAWYALKMANPELDLSQHLFNKGMELANEQGVSSPEQLRKAMLEPDFWEVLKINITGIFFRYGDLLYQSRIFKVLGMFIIGLVIGRNKFHISLAENRSVLKKVLVGGLLIGLSAGYMLASLKTTGTESQDPFNLHGLYESIAYAFSVAPLALAYSAAIALLFHSKARNTLSVLAPVGRMALTNYFFHTFIGILLFTGFGFAFPALGPTAWTILAFAIFIVQIFISTIWLRFFNYGPMEWLWRSATYGKWQSFRKKSITA